MRIVVWLVRALLFFVLFAFALNNQHEATVHWFFGRVWLAPMSIVVLIAFAAGCVLGVVAMVPSWWRQRRVARRHAPPPADEPVTASLSVGETTLPQLHRPPTRDGV